MQIGSLGLVHSIAMQTDSSEKSTEKSGFASLITGLMETVKNGAESAQTKEDVLLLSREKISKLVQFLNSADITDIENGSLLIDQLSNGLNMAEVIQDSMQMTDEEFVSTIISFLKGLDLQSNAGEDGFSEEKQSNLLEKLPELDAQDAFMSFVQILPNLNIEQMSFKLDQSFSDLTKSLKLLELLSNYEKTNINQQSLQQFLQKLGEKLEMLLKDDGSANRREFLHKILAPITRELNQQMVSKQTTLSLSTYPKQIIDNINIEAGLVMPNSKLDISNGGNGQTSSNVPAEIINNETGLAMPNTKLDSSNGESFYFQQMSKPEQLTITLDKSGQPVSTDQLIQQFEEIIAKSQLFKTGGTQRLFIKLNPDHLGALKVELIQKESGMIAKIVTTNGSAKDLLESQIQSLKNAFNSQNIPVERIEVSQQMSQQERFFNKGSHQQQEQSQQREQGEQKQQDQLFDISFADELINAKV